MPINPTMKTPHPPRRAEPGECPPQKARGRSSGPFQDAPLPHERRCHCWLSCRQRAPRGSCAFKSAALARRKTQNTRTHTHTHTPDIAHVHTRTLTPFDIPTVKDRHTQSHGLVSTHTHTPRRPSARRWHILGNWTPGRPATSKSCHKQG